MELMTEDKLIENLNARIRREVNRRLKLEQELDALRAAAKQVWDDLMIAHEVGTIRDVAEESIERLGSVLFFRASAPDEIAKCCGAVIGKDGELILPSSKP